MAERPRLTPAIADVRRAVRENLDAAAAILGRDWAAGDLVLVACSGGADSLALAAAAVFEGAQAKGSAALRVGAVIVEHGLQTATVEVAARTSKVLKGLGLDPVEVVKVSVSATGQGVEAAAREARYQALQAAALRLGARAILLGHTLDDQAETVLLGLARGSGARSLSGMKPVDLPYLRPLLGIRRAQTEAFCVESGLEPWHDPHNSDPSYTRVRVRQTVLPLLETELGPGVGAALARTADLLRADDEVLDQLALAVAAAAMKTAATSVSLDAGMLASQSEAIRNRVIKRALDLFGVDSSHTHVLAVAELIVNWHGQKALTLPGVRVERAGGTITLKSAKSLKPGAC